MSAGACGRPWTVGPWPLRGPRPTAVPHRPPEPRPPCSAPCVVALAPISECLRRAGREARPVVHRHHPRSGTRDVAFWAACLSWPGELALEAVTLCSRSGASLLRVTPRPPECPPGVSPGSPRPSARGPGQGGDCRQLGCRLPACSQPPGLSAPSEAAQPRPLKTPPFNRPTVR